MKRHDHPGLFVAIEGLDGSGSKVQAMLIANVLEKEGYRVLHTKEPTNRVIGGLIRAQLSGEWHAGPEALQLLFAADRAQHLEKEIMPALEAGKIIIADRYAFSTIAYGAAELGDSNWLKQLNDRFVLPDLTFIIEVSSEICALRMKETRYEIELYSEKQKLKKVWEAYETLVKEYPGVYIVNGERPEMEILHEIIAKIKDSLENGHKKEDMSKTEGVENPEQSRRG